MTQAEITPLQPLIDQFTAKGWFINRVGVGPDSYSLRVKSPRMTYPMPIYAAFTEEDLFIGEAEHVAIQNHMGPIAEALKKVGEKVITDIGALYLLQNRGKEGVVIPDEITINDLKIPLK